jgi:hypothetical protein
MQLIEDKTTSGETVALDGKHFVNCRYKNCKLLYDGGDCTWTDTTFEQCQLVLSGSAQKTAAFLGSFGILKPPTGATTVVKPSEPTVQ